MKKLLLLLCFCGGLTAVAQTTARLTNMKDAWGVTYTYVGEVKAGVPNGTGMALYPSDNTAMYYAGNFVNGQYSGDGVLLFNDGNFLSGEWRGGKLNGKGAYLNKDGSLYVGNYADGLKDGSGTLFYKDNSFLTGRFYNDKFEGRCIYVPASGATLTDNIYRDGKKNGTGYQYEVAEKKLYEGVWSNGDWVRAGTAGYASFVKNSKFYGEKTVNQILMGCINRAKNSVLEDSAFFYNFKTKKRYFGRYENGYLADGVVVKDDSTRFTGSINGDGAQGPGSFYKVGKFYDEGNYLDDYLDGPLCTSINLSKKTVYHGGMEKGITSGKGWYVNENKTLWVGTYVDGKFNGKGWKLKSDGTLEKGNFNDGLLLAQGSTDGKSGPIRPSN